MHDVTLLGRALSDPARIRILALLQQRELCVCELGDALELSQSTLSSHLQVIRQAGLVATRKNARWVYYALEPQMVPLIQSVFSHFQQAMDADGRLLRDRTRLAERLTLRVNGCCVVSSSILQLFVKGGEPHE